MAPFRTDPLPCADGRGVNGGACTAAFPGLLGIERQAREKKKKRGTFLIGPSLSSERQDGDPGKRRPSEWMRSFDPLTGPIIRLSRYGCQASYRLPKLPIDARAELRDMTGKGGHDPFSREKGHVPLFRVPRVFRLCPDFPCPRFQERAAYFVPGFSKVSLTCFRGWA